ncbi:hypothetical protein DFH06DRAFT_189067 [Mycena polygramma]|nr:hypothetical protein DFH06DRAFT_189067 [Mycena polygramma]
MSTTVLSPYNAHPHSQRLRLIRSIRKLGDLLTETAPMVDAPPPLPQHSRSTSVSSNALPVAESQMSPSSPYSRNFFSLRLPKSLTGDRTPISSPLSPTFALALNSPSTPIVDPGTLKERKLAKVTQTLGENVPPELVFPPPVRSGRKRSSTVSVPEYSTVDKRVVSAAGATVVGRRRHARAASRNLKHTASSTSLRAPVQGPEFEPFSYATLIPVSAFDAAGGPLPPDAQSATPAGASMHRKEAGWSGEWSGGVQNMDDVVRGLRGLKMK